VRSSYYTVLALDCGKHSDPNTSGNYSGFAIIPSVTGNPSQACTDQCGLDPPAESVHQNVSFSDFDPPPDQFYWW